MSLEQLYLLQLLGAVAVGGFVGEFFRAAHLESHGARIFLANFLAGSFLSFLIAYIIYSMTSQKQISIVLGALLSYQEQEFISETARKILKNWIDKGVKKE